MMTGGKTMNIPDRRTRSLKRHSTAETAPSETNHTRGKAEKSGWFFWRFLVCFFLMIFISFYVVTNMVMADKVKEIKEEVIEGVKETKEELKKVPEELKKAGQEIKQKGAEIKKSVEADVEEGKRNVKSIGK